MRASDFLTIGLSLEGVEEYSTPASPSFRVGGRKFASLASEAQGYGNLMLTLEQQAAFVEEVPEIFLPIPGGFGRMGHTHIHLAAAAKLYSMGVRPNTWKLRERQNRALPQTTMKARTPASRARRSACYLFSPLSPEQLKN